MITAQPNPTMADVKYHEAIQTWYEPALHLLNQMLETNRKNLRKRGHDEKNAAVKTQEWRNAMIKNHRLRPDYFADIEKSLFRAGRISYLGREFVTTEWR